MRIQGRLSPWSRPVKMTIPDGAGGGPVHPHGFLYLVAIMDWATRHVLAWRLSNTMDPGSASRHCPDTASLRSSTPTREASRKRSAPGRRARPPGVDCQPGRRVRHHQPATHVHAGAGLDVPAVVPQSDLDAVSGPH